MNAIKCCVEDRSEVKCEVSIYPRSVDNNQQSRTGSAHILLSERSPSRAHRGLAGLGELDGLSVGPWPWPRGECCLYRSSPSTKCAAESPHLHDEVGDASRKGPGEPRISCVEIPKPCGGEHHGAGGGLAAEEATIGAPSAVEGVVHLMHGVVGATIVGASAADEKVVVLGILAFAREAGRHPSGLGEGGVSGVEDLALGWHGLITILRASAEVA